MSREATRVIGEERTLPTPAVAGWDERERLAAAAAFREEAARLGAVIVSERRIRNAAFDGPNERTTFLFSLRWEPR